MDIAAFFAAHPLLAPLPARARDRVAAVSLALPLLAGEGALRSRGALIGVLTGLVGVVLGLVMYFLVLSGFDSM